MHGERVMMMTRPHIFDRVDGSVVPARSRRTSALSVVSAHTPINIALLVRVLLEDKREVE